MFSNYSNPKNARLRKEKALYEKNLFIYLSDLFISVEFSIFSIAKVSNNNDRIVT